MCVSEIQVKEIVHEELKPIRSKIDSARNWAMAVLIGLLATMFGIGTWVGSIDRQVNHVEQQHNRFEDKIDAKLSRIEDLILELSKK